jgi:CheY-like chemotaxis protein
MNGYEVCEALRRRPCGKEATIVALTGWGQDEDRRKSHDAGFDGHLVKPVEFRMLLSMLAELERPAACQ